MLFKIYAGLGGGFGGAQYQETVEFTTEQEAEDYAYETACSEYDSYVGMHGLREEAEIIEEENCSEKAAIEIFNEEREGWIDHYVEKTGL